VSGIGVLKSSGRSIGSGDGVFEYRPGFIRLTLNEGYSPGC